jgi:hypothetical protein
MRHYILSCTKLVLVCLTLWDLLADTEVGFFFLYGEAFRARFSFKRYKTINHERSCTAVTEAVARGHVPWERRNGPGGVEPVRIDPTHFRQVWVGRVSSSRWARGTGPSESSIFPSPTNQPSRVFTPRFFLPKSFASRFTATGRS